MNLLEISHLTVKYAETEVIKDVSFTVEEGQWLMIVGPNGAGKTTILNAISGSLPYDGEILFRGSNIHSLKPAELARHVGILSQHHLVGYDFTVREVVNLGRYAYERRLFGRSTEGNDDSVQEAIRIAGLEGMEHKSVLHLSGGEIQRAFLAQLFAQNPDIMILDEPANHLDLVYQKQVFELIGKWLNEPGRAVISVVHDLSLAKAYGTHCLLLNEGVQTALGPVSDVLTPDQLDPVYQMDVYAWMRKMLGQWT